MRVELTWAQHARTEWHLQLNDLTLFAVYPRMSGSWQIKSCVLGFGLTDEAMSFPSLEKVMAYVENRCEKP
jgi:hypothetical protein